MAPIAKVSKAYLVLIALVLSVLVIGLGDARLPLVVAFFMSYLLFPIIQILEKKGLPRQAVVLGVFGLTLVILFGAAVFVVPEVYRDAIAFTRELPRMLETGLVRLKQAGVERGFEIGVEIQSVGEIVKSLLGGLNVEAIQSFAKAFQFGIGNVVQFVVSLIGLFLFPIFFFYIVNDYESIVRSIKGFFPKSWASKLNQYLVRCNVVFSGYIRGQILVALILACLYSAGLSLVGLRFGLIIGLLTGLMSIIPYVGFTLGFISALAVMAAQMEGYSQVFAVLTVFASVQIFESLVLTPKLVGNKVGLSALPTMVALIVGGNLAGMAGMLLAIPVTAITRDIVIDLRKTAW